MNKRSLFSRPTLLMSAAAVTALALGACGASTEAASSGSSSSASSEGGARLAFASVSSQVPVVKQLGENVTAFMEGKGNTVEVQDADFDASKQAQQLTASMDNKQIDAAWIFPVAASALKPTLEAAQEKKIPVVVEGAPEDFGYDGAQPGIVFNAASFSDYGDTIAKEAASCISSNGGSAKVLFLAAPSTASGSSTVTDAIKSTFAKESPGSQIVATGEAADVASAQTKVTELLQAHPDVTAVIAASDETALGAYGAFAAAGKTASCLIDGGGGNDALDAQKAGKITTVVAWDYSSAVDAAGNALLKLIKDPTATGEVLSTPIKIIK